MIDLLLINPIQGGLELRENQYFSTATIPHQQGINVTNIIFMTTITPPTPSPLPPPSPYTTYIEPSWQGKVYNMKIYIVFTIHNYSLVIKTLKLGYEIHNPKPFLLNLININTKRNRLISLKYLTNKTLFLIDSNFPLIFEVVEANLCLLGYLTND